VVDLHLPDDPIVQKVLILERVQSHECLQEVLIKAIVSPSMNKQVVQTVITLYCVTSSLISFILLLLLIVLALIVGYFVYFHSLYFHEVGRLLLLQSQATSLALIF